MVLFSFGSPAFSNFQRAGCVNRQRPITLLEVDNFVDDLFSNHIKSQVSFGCVFILFASVL